MDGKAAAARLGGPVRLADARTGGASCDHRNTRAWLMPISPFTPHRGHDMADQWPLQSFLELGSLPGAVPCARLHVRHLLWEWDFRRKLHLMRIRDCVRAWRLPGAKMRCDLAVQCRECARRG
jgi:hypothetical protein